MYSITNLDEKWQLALWYLVQCPEDDHRFVGLYSQPVRQALPSSVQWCEVSSSLVPVYLMSALAKAEILTEVVIAGRPLYFLSAPQVQRLRANLDLALRYNQVRFNETTVEHLKRLAVEMHNPLLKFSPVKAKRGELQRCIQHRPDPKWGIMCNALPYRIQSLTRELRVGIQPTDAGYTTVAPDPNAPPMPCPFVTAQDCLG